MIRLKDVTKRYGNTVAIDNISIDIDENKVYCLLGCNGAGKNNAYEDDSWSYQRKQRQY
jgi:ABC-2 type transport system ATP-binding protein